MINIRLIDSTLREGMQGAISSPFMSEDSKVEYIDTLLESGVIDRFEMSRPGDHITQGTWCRLLSQHACNAQVYVGVAHKFEPKEHGDLMDGTSGMLSMTLIEKHTKSVKKLEDLSLEGSPLKVRVGIECVGLMAVQESVALVSDLASLPCVKAVSLNDSNGAMDRAWIRGFFEQVPDHIDTIGFHIHNGGLSASDKANQVALSAQESPVETLEFDVTAHGIGDHGGIFSLSDAVNMVPVARSATAASLNSALGMVRPYSVGILPDQAESHYEDDGSLRVEYY